MIRRLLTLPVQTARECRAVDQRRESGRCAVHVLNSPLTHSSQLHHALKLINNYFLGNTVYINSNEVSIADLAAYCELTQNRIVDLDLTKYPKVAAWMQRVEQVSIYILQNARGIALC